MAMSPAHQIWLKPFCKTQGKGERRQGRQNAGRQHQGMKEPGVRQVREGIGEQRQMEETGCEVICGAPTTLAVEGRVKVNVNLKASQQRLVVSEQSRTFKISWDARPSLTSYTG